MADDRDRAWLCSAPFTEKFANVSRGDVVSVLQQSNIAVTADVDPRIEAYLEFFKRAPDGRAKDVPQRFLIAVGRRPCEPREATIAFDDGRAPGCSSGREIRFFIARAGERVGKWVSAFPGEPGEDVYGAPVNPKGTIREVCVGAGLRVDSDDCVVAVRSGRVMRVGDEWLVVDVVEHTPSSAAAQSLESEADCHVKGDLPEKAELRTKRGVRVEGAVEGGLVEAGENVVVCGGVLGRGEHGRIVAAGGVRCRFCDAAKIEAGGDIEIDNEAVNAELHAGGEFRILSGGVVGGAAHAACGGQIESAGNDAMIPTQISIGVPVELLLEARRLDEESRQIQQSLEPVQARVQPLAANLKRLTAAQKEQLSALLYDVKEINAQLEDARQKAAAIRYRISRIEHARLRVRGMLYAGVRFRVGLREAAIRKNFRGPLTLESRVVRGATELVISFDNGRSQVLASAEVQPDPLERGDRVKRRT
ncbi:MAG: DUF342 domain-containing protein [Phycisphaerales bacterium]|nr:DUF342 domain-containing protein [Phycisphaerales bacterium]